MNKGQRLSPEWTAEYAHSLEEARRRVRERKYGSRQPAGESRPTGADATTSGDGRRGEIMSSHPARITAAELATQECANYIHGACGGYHPCGVAAGQTCLYFEVAVLPLHPNVSGYVDERPSPPEEPKTKRCVRCGSEYAPAGRHSLYCPSCAADARRDADPAPASSMAQRGDDRS